MKLVLLRHGIAEDRAEGKPDAERRLTENGIRELRQNAGYLRCYLRDEMVRLIASPLQRAVETAGILTEAGFAAGQAMEFVATGDFEALKQLVRTDPTVTYLIVGHTPILEEWIYRITDQSVELGKGAAALVEITDEVDFTGRIGWLLPLEKFDRLIRLGSFKELKVRFRQEITAVIDKYHAVILEHRSAYLKDPAEIESVHKLRVKIRQFRSLVSFFKPLLGKTKYRGIQAVLRGLAQECAYLRELDVLMKEWLDRTPEFQAAGLSGEHFLAVLGEERGREQERLYGVLERPDFARALADAVARLKGSLELDRSNCPDLGDMVGTTLTLWHDEIQAGYGAISANDLGIIHALRIKAKKMRYIMEVFELDTAPSYQSMYKEIKRWQEVLGNITDANRNIDAVLEIARRFPQAPIEAELEVFRQIQADAAEALYREFFGTTREGDVETAVSIES